MAALDLRTLIAVAEISAIVMAVFFAWFSRAERSRHLVFWTLGFALKSMAFMFIYERASLPRWLSMGVANLMVVLALQMFQAGVLALHDRWMRWGPVLAFDLVVLGSLLLLERMVGYTAFLLALSFFIAMANAMTIQALLYRIPKGMVQVQAVTAFLFGVDILLLLLRAVLMQAPGGVGSDPMLLTRVIFLKEILFCMLLGTAFLSMIYRHSHLKKMTLIEDLEYALARVNTLQGLLPICAWCKKIRDDKGEWQQLEEYVRRCTDAEFSHGICPECAARMSEALPEHKGLG